MDFARIKHIQYEWNADATPKCTILIDGEPLNCTDFALSQRGGLKPKIAIGVGVGPFRIATGPFAESCPQLKKAFEHGFFKDISSFFKR